MTEVSGAAMPVNDIPQQDSLLVTKLYIPRAGPNLVPRPRLTERINEGLHRKLTLISAPASFGKTALIIEWLHGRGSSETHPHLAPGPPANLCLPCPVGLCLRPRRRRARTERPKGRQDGLGVAGRRG